MILTENIVLDKVQDEDQKKIEEALNELTECREDVRNSDIQLIQAIAAAGTILGIIFGLSSVENFKTSGVPLFMLSVFVFGAAFSYITTLGITNVLRFHYIQYLEDLLSTLIPSKNKFVHWMSLSSTITTRNIKHLNSSYTRVHYFNYVIAIVFVFLFCGSLTAFQYWKLDPRPEYYYMIIPVVFFAFTGTIYILMTQKSKKMFIYAMEKARANQRSRETGDKERGGEKMSKREMAHIIMYFLYPKSKDLQKMFLIIVGFLTGVFLLNGAVTPHLIFEQWKNLAIIVLIIDVLIYQARYQWNDLRGLREDIQDSGKNRLPVKIMGIKNAVTTSLVIMFVKIVIALFLIIRLGGEMMTPLLLCTTLILLASIIYEIARSVKSNLWVFLIVSLGYPLRFLSGLWAAYPHIWGDSVSMTGNGAPYSVPLVKTQI